MVNLVLIAICGGLGCLGRHFIGDWVGLWLGKGFPFGTLAANILGAFIIGFIMEFSLHSTLIPARLRTGLTVGFLGGLTTFSTFSNQTFALFEKGEVLFATINAAGSVVAGIFFVWVGIYLARSIHNAGREDHDQVHG